MATGTITRGPVVQTMVNNTTETVSAASELAHFKLQPGLWLVMAHALFNGAAGRKGLQIGTSATATSGQFGNVTVQMPTANKNYAINAQDVFNVTTPTTIYLSQFVEVETTIEYSVKAIKLA